MVVTTVIMLKVMVIIDIELYAMVLFVKIILVYVSWSIVIPLIIHMVVPW